MTLHPDLETVLGIMLPYARQLISRRGATIPFGVLLGEGEPSFVAADFNRPREEMVSLVRLGLRKGAAKKRAAGLCYDAAHSPPDWPADRRAVRAELEHRDGTAVRIEVPWSRGWFGRIKWQDMTVLPGTPSLLIPAP